MRAVARELRLKQVAPAARAVVAERAGHARPAQPWGQLDAVGFVDLLEPGAVLAVEWADRFPEALPEDRIEVRITRLGLAADAEVGNATAPDEPRRIEIAARGPFGQIGGRGSIFGSTGAIGRRLSRTLSRSNSSMKDAMKNVSDVQNSSLGPMKYRIMVE